MGTGTRRYDAIVVGGRAAGATAALRLARAGMRVAIVERGRLGDDTLSTHAIFPNTVARLAELGVLERLLSRHEIPMLEYRIRILGNEFVGGWTPVGGFERGMAPRRVVLDRAIAEAAIEAGAEPLFGERVVGLLGMGTEPDPVRGVELENGRRLEATWTIGADGRASTVAAKLGLARERPLAANTSTLFAYWRGVPQERLMHLEADEDGGIYRIPCEDGIELLVANGGPEFTRGGPAARERAYGEMIRSCPSTIDPAAIDGARRITEIRSAPESMLRGFFRRPVGPGWVLAGDACHFKHPATAQGISDAVEQALYVADALTGEGPGLDAYESWRDDRASGHYEFSFQFGTLPRPDTAGPIFEGIASEPDAAQDLRDVISRRLRPAAAFSPERMKRWYSASPVPA